MVRVIEILHEVSRSIVVAATATTNSHGSSSYAVSECRTRVRSHYMRELTRGKFIVKNSNVTLLETIGAGLCI